MDTRITVDLRAPNRSNFIKERLSILIVNLLLFLGCLSTSFAYAAETPSNFDSIDIRKSKKSIMGIEIGALSILGTDFRMFYHQADSPWIIGYRYLDIEDDFMNEWAVGLPGDDSDREFTKRSGPYLNYLFKETSDESYYLAAALYNTKTRIVCSLGEDSDSATGLYFGGGLRKKWNANLGYDIGMLLSPGANLSVDANNCSSESDGDIDVNASIFFTF